MTNTQHFSEYFTTHMQVDDVQQQTTLKNNYEQHAPTKSFPDNLIAHFIKSLMSKQLNLNTQVQKTTT